MNFVQIMLTVLLCTTALIGDYFVFKSKYSGSQMFRAFSDSSVHAIIGLLSAILFFTYEAGLTHQTRIYNVVFCTVLSSFIDVDHFIAARSFRLKDLTNLKHRGILHCTTFWLLITAASLLYTHLTKRLSVYTLTHMAMLAFLSHHVRDGNRRGLWLYPFGHTPAIDRRLYVPLIGALPRALAHLHACARPPHSRTVAFSDTLV